MVAVGPGFGDIQSAVRSKIQSARIMKIGCDNSDRRTATAADRRSRNGKVKQLNCWCEHECRGHRQQRKFCKIHDFLQADVLGEQAAMESGGRKSAGDSGGDVDSSIEVTAETSR
jgi:hypothetical protein